MPFPLIRLLDPATEPVSLADMKNYLRVDITDDDPLISNLISVARERAEDITSRCLLAQQWMWMFDKFPGWWGTGGNVWGDWDYGRHQHSMFKRDELTMVVPRGPVLSIDSIQYVDLTGTLQTLPSSQYEVDNISNPARLTPIYNSAWPVALYDTNSVKVTFTAGHQQTVTETVVLSAQPCQATVTRQLTALSLTSATDVLTGNPIAGTMLNGVVSFPTGVVGQAVSITYQVTSIPQSIIHAIKLIASAYYENRAEIVQGGGNFNTLPTPMSANSLLGTYKLFQVGYPRG